MIRDAIVTQPTPPSDADRFTTRDQAMAAWRAHWERKT